MNASIRTIAGNIGSIKTYHTETGKVFARVRIAYNHRLLTTEGVEEQFTSWYTVKIWDEDEIKSFERKFALGDFIQVRGTVSRIVYVAEDGSRQSELEVNPSQVTLLYSKRTPAKPSRTAKAAKPAKASSKPGKWRGKESTRKADSSRRWPA